MSFTPTDLQNLVIASLANAEPTALQKLQVNVPKYWALHSRVMLAELRYWYVRRDAIRLCMGCNLRSVDSIRKTQNAERNSIESGTQTSIMTSTATEISSAVADRASTSEYDAETNSTGSGTNTSSRSSSQENESNMSYADIGNGSTTARQISHQEMSMSDVADVKEVSTEAHEVRQSRLASQNKGSNSLGTTQNTAWQTVSPADFGLSDFPQGVPVGLMQTSTTQSESSSSNESVSDIYSSVKNSANDTPARQTETNITVTTMPQHSQTMSGYDVPMTEGGAADLNPASTRKSSSQSFTANVDSSQDGSGFSSMTATGQSQSSSEMTGEGAGSSTSSGTSESESNAVSNRDASGTGQSNRSNQGLSQMNSLLERAHQRFEHLQELWQQASEMIELFETQKIGITAYVHAQIIATYPSGYRLDIANKYIVPGIIQP